eukprot:GFUD01068399.1.p1 GENE.GFUD01068399.1~~GFUD01068399.1.p1  ORF type:complete len:197 (+),score=30.41 GFUD01068399.1:28-591(+)
MSFGQAHIYMIDKQETRLIESILCSEIAWYSKDWMVYFEEKNRKKVWCRSLQRINNFMVDIPTSHLRMVQNGPSILDHLPTTPCDPNEMNRFHNVVCLLGGTLVFSLSNFWMGTYTPNKVFKYSKKWENISFLESFEDLAYQADEAILKIHQKGVIVAFMNFDLNDHEKGLVNLSRKITKLQMMGTF